MYYLRKHLPVKSNSAWLKLKAGIPVVELILHTDTLPKKADGSNNQPLLPTLHWLHQFWHQPSLQYIALDPVYTHT